ncbi:hypothetical protein BGZ95_002236 [Linnemannia exigua]|uniref:F-box domain-containing protein n=1 Tax=Linnemannia exigua TaxID=604196 RepID=A0AAD4D5U3_9FUNG|nr:hypothetical protein BGZ95_002236 [Linnemannia exigua]
MNPFDLPELRHRISRFVTIKDALTCALVAKAWSDDFLSAVWFTIDFDIHPQFADLSPDVVTKHGDLIRIVRNARTTVQVSILDNVQVNNLKELRIEVAISDTHRAQAYEVVARNRSSLETEVLGDVITSFQHMDVVNFGSTFKSIFRSFSTCPSLLSYFPNLTTLSTFNYNAGDSGPSSARVKRETSLYCPRLSGYYLEDDTGYIIHKILTKVANNNTVEKIRFLYEHVSQDLVTAILLHQSCLRVITHFDLYAGFDLDKDELVPVKNQMEESKKLLQLIPRRCPKLEHVDLHAHEMDMDDVEMEEWVCKDLKTIRVRIKDLDTKDKILRAVTLWRKGCWRRWQEQAGALVGEEGKLDEADMSIEARVARHLIKFGKLWKVWLGYQTWTPI